MRARTFLPIAVALLTISGCYSSVVETGRQRSGQRVRDDWVMGYASGLVMFDRLNVGRSCQNGIARIETSQSLPNFVVQTVTAGLLSPRTVEVTCAAAAGELGTYARESFRWEPRRGGREVRREVRRFHGHR